MQKNLHKSVKKFLMGKNMYPIMVFILYLYKSTQKRSSISTATGKKRVIIRAKHQRRPDVDVV